MGDLEKVGDRDDGVHARVQAEFAARLAGHIADRHEQRRAVEHRFGRQHPVVCRVRRTEERKLRERRVRFTDIDEPVLRRVPHLLELLERPSSQVRAKSAGPEGGTPERTTSLVINASRRENAP